MIKKILLIGSQPDKMTRLQRTYWSLKKLGFDVEVMHPYTKPDGAPRTLKGIIRYLILLIQVAISKADIYHFFNVPDIIGLPLLLKRGKVIFDIRTPWFSAIKESLGNSFLSKVAKVIEYMMTRGADVVLSANYLIAYRAYRLGARRITMVPNYPPASFGPQHDREFMRNSLKLGNRPTVLFLGKISKIEGSNLLKRIIGDTSKAIPEVLFLIVGNGPEEDSLKSFIQRNSLDNNVLMTGWISHDDVPDYIVASDICLLPRRWDSLSSYTAPESVTKASEYLAIGKPIIAPKMGGFATAEFPVISVDPSEMTDALINFLKNPKPFGSFPKPSWDISHERLRRVYSTLSAIESQDSID